ncbi:MAG: hypothetical protein MH252_08450 [Thermosynechococcaceae cyanobacterium MS004]|nr:hypothetical protein [Thermosynechococcaceae cyanobacterium MS004]
MQVPTKETVFQRILWTMLPVIAALTLPSITGLLIRASFELHDNTKKLERLHKDSEARTAELAVLQDKINSVSYQVAELKGRMYPKP